VRRHEHDPLKPTLSVPEEFYNRRAMPRDPSLPLGRDEMIATPTSPSDDDDPVPEGNMTAMANPGTTGTMANPGTTGIMANPGTTGVMADPGMTGSKQGGCSLQAVSDRANQGALAAFSLLGAGLALARRRRRR
jgi:MYXO-CTERM domain-containing protein